MQAFFIGTVSAFFEIVVFQTAKRIVAFVAAAFYGLTVFIKVLAVTQAVYAIVARSQYGASNINDHKISLLVD